MGTTRDSGAKMTVSFHAEGGDTSRWLQPNVELDDIQTQWANSFNLGFPAHPWDVELRPIWEVVSKIDKAKGDALQAALEAKWAAESVAFNPQSFFDTRGPELPGFP